MNVRRNPNSHDAPSLYMRSMIRNAMNTYRKLKKGSLVARLLMKGYVEVELRLAPWPSRRRTLPIPMCSVRIALLVLFGTRGTLDIGEREEGRVDKTGARNRARFPLPEAKSCLFPPPFYSFANVAF